MELLVDDPINESILTFSAKGKFWVNNHAHIIRVDDKILFKYLEYYLNATDLKKYITGSAQPKLNRQNLDKIKIKIPEKKLMKQIVEEINIELDIINIIVGFFTSMIFAFFTIKLFLKIIEKIGMIPFIAYRVLLGVFLLLM